MTFPDSFSTGRLLARRVTESDLEELRRLHTDASVMAHIGGVRSQAQTEAYLAQNLRHWNDHGFGLWMVLDGAPSRVAGLAVLRHLSVAGADEVEVGYSLHQEFWGRGLATEIASACSAHGYGSLGLESLVAVAGPSNWASHRVLRKVGMAFERDMLVEGQPWWLFRGRRPAGPGPSPVPTGGAA